MEQKLNELFNEIRSEPSTKYLDYINGLLVKDPVAISMYYDDYERRCGDGFYPQLLNSEGLNSKDDILFVQSIKSTRCINNIIMPTVAWIQINNGCIEGLDGNCGNQLLTELNKHANDNCPSQIILCTAGVQIHPKLKKI